MLCVQRIYTETTLQYINIIFFNKLWRINIKSIDKRYTLWYIIANLTGLEKNFDILTHFWPMFHLRINQVAGFY